MIHNEALREQFENAFSGHLFIYLRVGTRRGHQLGIIKDDQQLGAAMIHVLPPTIVLAQRDDQDAIDKLIRTLNRDRLRVPALVVQNILDKQAAVARREQSYERYRDDLRPIA